MIPLSTIANCKYSKKDYYDKKRKIVYFKVMKLLNK
jgi:hypothetical protein